MTTTHFPSVSISDRSVVTVKWFPVRGRMNVARFIKDGETDSGETVLRPDSLFVRDGGRRLDYQPDIALDAIDSRVRALLRADGYDPRPRQDGGQDAPADGERDGSEVAA